MKALIRLFIAIEISEKQKHELTCLQNRMRHHLEGVRWVRPEGLHLTLKFIGETEEDNVASIKKAMDLTASSITGFQITFGGCGAFPSLQKARIIWIGLDNGSSEVKRMAEELQKYLSKYGFAREKRTYHPHLTLGRFRYPLPDNITNEIIEHEASFVTSVSEVGSVNLFKSQLLPQGAVHTTIYKTHLKV